MIIIIVVIIILAIIIYKNDSKKSEKATMRRWVENIYATDQDGNKIDPKKVKEEKEKNFLEENRLIHILNGKELIEGIINVRDYNSDSVTETVGTFKLSLEKETIIQDNAILYFFTTKENDEESIKRHFREKNTIFQEEILKNAVFYILELSYYKFDIESFGKHKYNLHIYQGAKKIDTIYNIAIGSYHIIDNLKFTYTDLSEVNKGIYKHMLFDNKEKKLLKIDDIKHFGKSLYNEEIEHKQEVSIIDSNGCVNIYFFVNGGKRSIILREYCKRKGFLKRLENCFEDDDTENYEIIINKNNLYDLVFIYYCLGVNSKFDNIAIYNIKIDEYLIGVNNDNYPLLNKNWMEDNDKVENYKELMKEIYIKYGEEYSENKFPSKFPYPIFYTAEQTSLLLELLNNSEPAFRESYQNRISGGTSEDYDKANRKKRNLMKKIKTEYDNLYQELIATTDYFKSKWINEFTLYKLVKQQYHDAIYQYHKEWLELQSLDIYIPSLKVGIEYQGMQHYKPIDFFGGEKEFEHRKKLDLKKKEKCRENNIKLIEWKYDEPISNVMLTKKMEKLLKNED